MRNCDCGRPVRLSVLRVSVNRRRGVAHAIVHMDDDTAACGGDWSCCAMKPYPSSPSDQEWSKLLTRWAASRKAANNAALSGERAMNKLLRGPREPPHCSSCECAGTSEVEALRARVAELEERLDAMMPLFEEARDALPAITLGSAKLRGIRLDLADRMDDVGDPERWAARKSASAASADIDAARAAEAKK